MTQTAISRADLERWPRERLGAPSSLKPAVWRVETPDGPLVVKDARPCRFGARWLGRWLLARERNVLQHVAPLDCVPHIVSQIDRDALAITLLPGRPLDKQTFRERPRELADQLIDVTERMHALGVFHLDLRQRKNLLVDDAGRLLVVDFGAALAPGAVLRALCGPLLRYVDRQAAYKYLARFTPEELTETEARAVLRQRKLRKLWPFTASGRRETLGARKRLG